MTSSTTYRPAWIDALTLEEMNADTDAVFARLRAESPLAWIPALNAWIATTWELCASIADDAEQFAGGTNPMLDRLFGVPHVLGAEAETHASLRSILHPPLRPRTFRSRLEERVRPLAAAQLGQIADRGAAELMSEYFEPISVRCVAEAFGFDEVPTDTLRSWFHRMAVASANTTDEHGDFLDPHGFDEADQVREEVRGYLTGMREQERAATDDGPRALLFRSGRPEGDLRPVEDLLPSMLVVFLGGLQEPGHACGTTQLALSSDPELLARVVAEPSLLPRAIAEALRWMSPLYSGASRVATHDISFAGRDLAAGDAVWLSYGSANRDEAAFEHPADYDLDREQRPNLAFGRGRHACPGSAFAPQIARIALEELHRGLPSIRLDPSRPPLPVGWLFRGAPELHSVWDRT